MILAVLIATAAAEPGVFSTQGTLLELVESEGSWHAHTDGTWVLGDDHDARGTDTVPLASHRVSASTDLFAAELQGRLGSDGLHLDPEAEVHLGARGSLATAVKAGPGGVSATASADAHAGARAQATLPLTASLCGLETTVSARAQASLGAGASGRIGAILDWGSGTLELNATASATLGLGAGLGTGLRVDLGPLLRERPETVACVRDALARATRAHDEATARLLAETGLLVPELDWALPPVEADFDALLQDLDDVLCDREGC